MINKVMIYQLMKNNSMLIVTKKDTTELQKMTISLNKNIILLDEFIDNGVYYNPLNCNIDFMVEKFMSLLDKQYLNEKYFRDLQEYVLYNAIELLLELKNYVSLYDLDILLQNYNDKGRKEYVIPLKRKSNNQEKNDKLIDFFLNDYYTGMYTNQGTSTYNYCRDIRLLLNKLVNSNRFEIKKTDISNYLNTVPENTVVICQLYNDKISDCIYRSIKADISYYIENKFYEKKFNKLKDNFFFIYDDENGVYSNRKYFTENEENIINNVIIEHNKNFNLSLGTKIKEIRTLNKLSQEELAIILDVSKNYISDVERDNKSFSLQKLNEFCNTFDVSLDSLLPKCDCKKKLKEIKEQQLNIELIFRDNKI